MTEDVTGRGDELPCRNRSLEITTHRHERLRRKLSLEPIRQRIFAEHSQGMTTTENAREGHNAYSFQCYPNAKCNAPFRTSLSTEFGLNLHYKFLDIRSAQIPQFTSCIEERKDTLYQRPLPLAAEAEVELFQVSYNAWPAYEH